MYVGYMFFSGSMDDSWQDRQPDRQRSGHADNKHSRPRQDTRKLNGWKTTNI